MHVLLLMFILLLSVNAKNLIADTATTKFSDPARNRLLTVSTGEVMPSDVVSFGIHEIFLGQLGFTTGESVQWNASLLLFPFTGLGGHPGSGSSGGIFLIPYVSAGVKWQFAKQQGMLGNMAVGSDFGIVAANWLNHTTLDYTVR